MPVGVKKWGQRKRRREPPPLRARSFYLPPQLQQFVGVSAPPSAMPAGKKSSTGKQTLSNISQGSSQELHEMLPTGWQLLLGMQ